MYFHIESIHLYLKSENIVMKSNFFRKVIVVILLIQSFTVFSQDSKALANAYLVKAEESFKAKNNANAEKYLNKSIQYFGENQPKELAHLATKFYVSNKKYPEAKKYAELYFKKEKNKNSKEYNEMLLTFIEIEDHIESGEVVKDTIVTVKEVKKEMPTVAKSPKKTTKKKEKGEVGKTLRETYLLSKKYFDKKKYAFAKQNLDKFFALNPKEGTRFYKEMIEVKNKVEKETIEVVNDEKDVEETVIESTETDEDVPDEKEVKNIPFALIEEVPVFPGCSGTRKEKSDCLNKSLQKHISENFNADVISELGLSPGKKKIWLVFRIDEKGNAVDFSARAPHPRLKKEAVRIAELIPQMEPGKQRGKPVGMKYTLPISFNVEAETEKEVKDN